MIQQKYVLFVVLNNIKKTRTIIKHLRKIGVERFTLINTFGSYSLCGKGQTYEPIVAGTYKSSMSHIKRRYNKTFFIVLNSEKEALKVMDELEEIMNIDVSKPGNGIMFTVPVIMSEGIRDQEISIN